MKTDEEHTILTDLLTELDVPFTAGYSIGRYDSMPFKSLFGLSKLLADYGVDSEGVTLADRKDITRLPTPFIASTPAGLIIVTAFESNRMHYLTQGTRESIDTGEFIGDWNGKAFIAYPRIDAAEPDYRLHRRDELIAKAKNAALWCGLAVLFLYLFISNGLWQHCSTTLIAAIDIAGLYLTWMLMGKMLNIKSRAADNVCRILQEGGCDTVLETSAAKFFGIFSWSEVGFTYFSVSLLTLLIFPEFTGYLALCNLCCLPFTAWSIWYQKFRAKAWCTLCVSVQTSLWLLFFCYLGGGWISQAFPLRIEFFVLGATYLTVLLALNRIMPHFTNAD